MDFDFIITYLSCRSVFEKIFSTNFQLMKVNEHDFMSRELRNKTKKLLANDHQITPSIFLP